MINETGEIPKTDPSQTYKKITWNIIVNPNDHDLNNVVITDTLGSLVGNPPEDHQTYIPDSLTITTGSYKSGQFISDGQSITPTVTTSGDQFTISLPNNISKTFNIIFSTSITSNKDNFVSWMNRDSMSSNEGTFNVDSTAYDWISIDSGGNSGGGGINYDGSITLNKTDPITGNGLQGAEYKITNNSGETIMPDVITDTNGKLVIDNAIYGDYTLTEVKAPDGYQLNPSPIQVTIPSNGMEDITVNQTDSAEPGAVILEKLDSNTNAAVAGATFKLLDNNGNIVKENLVTDDNGKIAVDNLAAGDYSFVETQPATGYELNSTPVNFTVVAGQTTPVEVEKFNVNVNEATISNSGQVILTKVDTTNTPLAGAVYNLLDSNGKVIESNLTTDENGQIKITDIDAGDYSFVEVTPPSGYELNKDPINFTVVKDSTNNLQAKDEKISSTPSTVTPPTNNSDVNPEQPNDSDTGNSSVNPNNPDNSNVNPEQPNDSDTGNSSVNPNNPDNSNVNPGQPNDSGTGNSSVNPNNPNNSDVNPEQPNNSGTGNSSINPNNPDNSNVNPGQPNNSGTGHSSTNPNNPDNSNVNPEQPNDSGTGNSSTNPSKPNSPVINPESPNEPSATYPSGKPSKPSSSNTVQLIPGKPGITSLSKNPSYPASPVINPENSTLSNLTTPTTKKNAIESENSNAITQSLLSGVATSNSIIPASQAASYGKGKFPQTGNKNSWVLIVIGFILGIAVIIKKRTKHEN
ncbi:SpaA isopeptide-forming pilin-related protein [Companilactobacillus halodurans]|uniref:LPXTG cell wall anchor domain-containing protein n=1 Tax=Companilactobacillus halodurans TaxID=2584183 RepID=A0A5P0ZYX0_9LACO|nr:SpaA isopeptide-forming pilin-related protein [Companilactobacillus halodurans]MQS98220.1 LPXTG cell wall anchor domain-containing protein [Companilactobacillus halodurans]